MSTEFDSPQSRALFQFLIGAAENTKASKRNSPINDRDAARSVAVQFSLPTRDAQLRCQDHQRLHHSGMRYHNTFGRSEDEKAASHHGKHREKLEMQLVGERPRSLGWKDRGQCPRPVLLTE
jgi:hypothetical protein